MYDRAAEDIGNIVELGHVNITVPDQSLATLFYVSGLGLTRDPYLVTGVENMWVNVGRAQFHLPTRAPQVLRGVTGLIVPDLDGLRDRLARVAAPLAGTRFSVDDRGDHVAVTCPWGNRMRVHAPDRARFGNVVLGMPYVACDVPTGTVDGIARFYRDILSAIATTGDENGHKFARVVAGDGCVLLFHETTVPALPFDRHHIQVTLADFSGPHRRLLERGLVTEESSQHQYRFQDIVDPADGRVLFTIEHEVRSMTHPLYGRTLVNRNPAQTNREYTRGLDALTG